ncbi:ALC-interacting protein 1 [Wolffia australiana]
MRPSSSGSHGGAACRFPAIFRRLLCGALDLRRVSDAMDNSLEISIPPPPPGLIARLMGLEIGLPRSLEFIDTGEFLVLNLCDYKNEEDSQRMQSSLEKKPEKRKKKKMKESSSFSTLMAESVISVQNTSPVSVLSSPVDLDGGDQTDSSSPISDGDDEASPRKNSSRNCECQETERVTADFLCYEDPWVEASRMVELERQNSNWVSSKTDELHEIAAELGLLVLDALLQEVVSLIKPATSVLA